MSNHSTIRNLIAAQVRHNAQAVALLAPDRPPMTYRRLLERMDAVAAHLHHLGIARSDRVAIVLSNGPEMAVAFLAVASAATAAPLNPGYRAPEFDFFLADLQAKALLVDEGSDSPAIAVAESRGIPVIRARIDRTGEAGALQLLPESHAALGTIDEARPEDVALILHTSGTTSRPKIVPLSHANLCASAQHIRDWLALSPDARCLNVMPLFHIHGLVAALLSSLAGGGSVACTPGFVATSFFDWLRALRPTWYSAVPTMHQAILARATAETDAAAAAPLRFIRSSSAPLPPQVAEGLERTFGVPVIEAYGMTEAAHQMCSNPLPPRPRRFGSVGLPAGPRVAIMNDAGHLLPPGQSGEVVIQGPNVTTGYLANPQANAAAFTAGWFRTGDIGSFDADGYLYLSGRIKEIINRGGEKISPREIDEVLLDHPAVAAAISFGMPDPRLGEEVAAAVVLRPAAAAASEAELMAFAASRLADFKVPRRIVFLDELPKGPTGKPQRIGLAKRLGLTAVPGAGPAPSGRPPQTLVEQALAKIWQEVLQVEHVAASDHFFEIGGDSISAAQVLARVRQQMDSNVAMLVFFQSPTLEAMAAAIAQASELQADSANVDAAQLEALLTEVESIGEDAAQAQLDCSTACPALAEAAKSRP